MCSTVPQIHPLVDDCEGEAKRAAKRKVRGFFPQVVDFCDMIVGVTPWKFN